MTRAIWGVEHVEYLAGLDLEKLTYQELSVLMSKHFKMRVTAGNVSALLTKMRKPSHPFFRNVPYRATAARHSY